VESLPFCTIIIPEGSKPSTFSSSCCNLNLFQLPKKSITRHQLRNDDVHGRGILGTGTGPCIHHVARGGIPAGAQIEKDGDVRPRPPPSPPAATSRLPYPPSPTRSWTLSCPTFPSSSSLPPRPKTPTTFLPSPSRLVAIGDLHADLPKSLSAAPPRRPRAPVLHPDSPSASSSWAAGPTLAVQLGDILDRGGDELRLLYLLYRLSLSTETRGGTFLPILGNHEVMNVSGDFRFATPQGFHDRAGGGVLACAGFAAWAAEAGVARAAGCWRADVAGAGACGSGGLLARGRCGSGGSLHCPLNS
jgi:hypothetical protein